MAVRTNGFYNSPEIGQAFTNLASAFAPPSGSDVAGFANAALLRQKQAGLAELLTMAKGPQFNPDVYDRVGSAVGAFNPNQGFGARDQLDARERASFASRDATEMAKQALANDAAMARTRFEDTTKRDDFASRDRTALNVQLNSPVAAGATRFPTPDVQAAYRLPPQQVGVLSANEGETVRAPDGTTLNGVAKPMSEEQYKAAILRGLPQSEQRAVVTAPVKLEAVQRPDGTTENVASIDAINRTPAVTQTGAPKDGLAILKDGTRVPAVKMATGWVHAQTGQKLPDDIQVYDTPKPQGSDEQIGIVKPTEFTDKNAIFASRATPASANMDEALAGGYVPSVKDYELSLGGAGDRLPGSLANMAVSDEGRKFYSNATNFMMSVLRPDTGAAFGKDEYQSYAKVFVPIPGDDPATLQQKSEARQIALSALQGTSRGAYEKIVQRMQAQGLSVPPEFAKVAGGKAATAVEAGGQAAKSPLAGEVSDALGTLSGPAAPAASSGGVVTVSSPEEARKLAPGTKFRTPDGRELVR